MTTKQTTESLPASVFGVKRTVTMAAGQGYVTAARYDQVRALIAARYLTERGKAKSQRDLAVSWGIDKSKVGRLAIMADMLWSIGPSATESDAKHIVTIVNTANAHGLGSAKAYLPEGATGSALSKALPAAAKQVAADRQAKQAERAEQAEDKPTNGSGARSGKVTTTGPRSDKGRATLAEQTLAAIKGKVSAESALSILAHALRVAFDSAATSDAIVATLAEGLSDDTVAAVAAVLAEAEQAA